MGVAGLWDILRPASKTRSLTELSVTEGFEKNPSGVRGYRLGIDASIWFFHAEYGREGENPVLRTLFFRCATLMKSPFLPLFVFDGPKRPDVKRGKKINKTPNKLIPGMKQIVEAFGFEHRTAPGEAEAELAYLNSIGAIDGILSDDVDNFLFGAKTVIRNNSNTLSGNRSNPVLNSAGKDDKNHSWVYNLDDIVGHPDVGLSRGGLILIGLMSGGDYQQGGLERCGVKTAVALARCGFGDSLYKAAINLPREKLPDFLETWRHELRHELMSNSRKILGRKSPSLAKSMTSEFPDIDVLLSYVHPITSESMGRGYTANDLTWKKEPDIAKLAATCEFYFEWGYKEAIIKRFRTVIWHSAVLRILRRAVLNLDEAKRAEPSFSTPRKKHREQEDACGTPSKMITKYFSSLNISDHPNGSRDEEEDDEDDEERLIIKIHSARNHISSDKLLEYRLEIAPGQLVRLAESGIAGTRVPEGPDEWASEDDDDGNEGGKKKGTKKGPVDPESHMRLWMPACMVKLVEPRLVAEHEAVVEQKLAKKAGKGMGRKKKAVETGVGSSKVRRVRRPILSDGEDDEDELPSLPTKRASKKAAVKKAGAKAISAVATSSRPKSVLNNYLSSDDEDLPSPSLVFGTQSTSTTTPTKRAPAKSKFIDICSESEVESPSPRKRAGIKDLTKKKSANPSVSIATTMSTSGLLDMKSYFSVTKSSNIASTASKSTKAKTTSVSTVLAPASISDIRQTPVYESPSRLAPAPFPIAFSEGGSMDEQPQPDDFFSTSTPIPHNPSPTRGKKSRDRQSSLSSTDSLDARIKKSPRKSSSQTTPSDRSGSSSSGKAFGNGEIIERLVGGSPFHRMRAASPTPLTTLSVVGSSAPASSPALSLRHDKLQINTKKKIMPVIEISSSDDDDDDDEVLSRKPVHFQVKARAPPLNPPIMDTAKLPPLLAARARVKNRTNVSTSSRLGAVIDLT